MNIDIQMKIKNTKNYYKYLKENSYWIRYLNRNYNNFKEFDSYVKDKYKLKISDRVLDTLDTVDIISTILSSIN